MTSVDVRSHPWHGRLVVALSVLLMVGVGVGFVAWRWEPSRAAPSTTVERVTSSARHQFRDVPELLAASDLVVVGEVVADEEGRVFGAAAGDGRAAIRSHVLTVAVERVLVGGASAPTPDAVVLVEEEHSLPDGTRLVVDGMRAGRVGDRGVWFLAAGGDPELPAFALVNSQGRYLFTPHDRLRGGDPSDPLVRRIQSLGPDALAQVLTETG